MVSLPTVGRAEYRIKAQKSRVEIVRSHTRLLLFYIESFDIKELGIEVEAHFNADWPAVFIVTKKETAMRVSASQPLLLHQNLFY